MAEVKEIMNFLGLSRKAGKLQIGHDSVIESIVKDKSELLILASDASERLKNEIKQLKELQKSQSNRKSRKKQDVSPVKISAIDESIVDADWLISIPPEGTVTRPASSTNPEDFGYQAPPKKNTPENEAQMSLW